MCVEGSSRHLGGRNVCGMEIILYDNYLVTENEVWKMDTVSEDALSNMSFWPECNVRGIGRISRC